MKGENSRSCTPRSMPMPLSRTRTIRPQRSTAGSVSDSVTSTPPCSVNFSALATRLTSTCRSRVLSPCSQAGRSGLVVALKLRPLSRACGAYTASISASSPAGW